MIINKRLGLGGFLASAKKYIRTKFNILTGGASSADDDGVWPKFLVYFVFCVLNSMIALQLATCMIGMPCAVGPNRLEFLSFDSHPVAVS